MPFALVTVGLLLVIVGFQNTYKQLGVQVQKDFTGQGNFIYWIVAIGVVGALGYAKPFQTFSRTFMALIIIVIFLSNKGFFTSFNQAIQSGSTTPVDPIGANLSGNTGSGGGGSSSTGGGGSGTLGSVVGIASDAASLFGF